jgi:hypothetical protein
VNPSEHAHRAVSDYREFRPPRALAEYLLCFWTQTVGPRVEFPQRVLPDCCVDVLLINEVPVVVGPWTEPFVAALPPGTNVVGARCHPGLAPSLLGMPASIGPRCCATYRASRLASRVASVTFSRLIASPPSSCCLPGSSQTPLAVAPQSVACQRSAFPDDGIEHSESAFGQPRLCCG